MADYDVLIVGAGIAGLHCALRISEKFPSKRIAIAEAYDYTGGRIFTFDAPIHGLHWESGAGRINTKHTLTCKYVDNYGLTRIPIETGSKWVAKGKTSTQNDWDTIIKTFVKTLSKIPKAILVTHTLHDLLCKVYNQSIVESILSFFPYRAEVMTLRADLAIESFRTDMAPDASFFVIKEGFSSLPDAMEEELVRRGVTFLFNHRCISLHSKDVFPMMAHFKTSIESKTLSATKIILAIPSDALCKLSHFKSYPILKHLKASPLLRTYAVFPKGSDSSMWFEGMSRTVTNTPLRHIIPINSNKGIIMTSYTDGDDTLHWEKLKKRGTGVVAKEIVKELQDLFPKSIIPNPLYFKYHYWPYGATYWIPGLYDVKKESQAMLRPFPTRLPDLYVCGESYSLKQAWVEGALEHAEELISKYFS
jgi:monoamine oxidase